MAQYGDHTTEGSEGVPLSFSRPAMVSAAVGLAAACTVLGSMPASADAVRQHEWWLSKLGITSAWPASRGSGITVAVLSDGVNPAQPDLVNSVTTGPDFTRSGRAASGAYFGLQGTPITSLIAGHGHGTNGSEGIIGVAPTARILSIRVTLSPGDPLLTSTSVTARLPSAIAAGIRYAVSKGASVIDLPMDPGQPGATGTGSAPAAAGGSAAEKAAVAYARTKGAVLVAPAGDNGAGSDAVNYPAAYPGVISVGAFDHGFIKAAYSSHQPYVTLTAAGAGVIAATEPGSYATTSSTSSASAIVAGIAALIRSRFPVLAPAQVTRALIHSTVFRRPDGIAVGSGHGTANAARALARAAVIAAPLVRRAAARAAATRQAATALPIPSTTSRLVPKVLRVVVISAGALILLLLPITAYAAVSRRRARRAARAAPKDRAGRERAPGPGQPAPASFAYAGTDGADPMLEFFSAPAQPPPSAATAPAWASASAERISRAEADSPVGPRFLADRSGYPGSGWPGERRARVDPGGLAGSGARPGGSAPAGPSGAGRSAGSGAAGSVPRQGAPWGTAHAHDPFAAASERLEPASDSFRRPGDPFVPPGEPLVAAGDPPDGPGPDRAGSHSRAGSPALRPPPLGPVSRSASRQPRISGAPPWEPAAKPDSELPWVADPAPHIAYPVSPALPTNPARAAHRRVPRHAPPPAAAGRPSPPAAASSPWPPAPAPLPPPSQPGADGSIWDVAAPGARRTDAGRGASTDPGRRDSDRSDPGRRGANGLDQAGNAGQVSAPDPAGRADPGTGPIYVWNPSASTESFPAVPPDPDPDPARDPE